MRMTSGLYIKFLLLTLVYAAYSAPVENKEVSKRRETTLETLELESSLKRLAGENKQYYPGLGSQPIPQVDGLEDKHEAPLTEQDDVSEEADETSEQSSVEDSNNDSNDGEQISENVDGPVEEIEPINDVSDEENVVSEDMSDESELDNNNEVDYNSEISNYYPEQGVYDNGYVNYRDDYSPYVGVGGSDDREGENEEYALQDVMEMMNEHPELWARIMQAKGDINNEDIEDQEQQQFDEDSQEQHVQGTIQEEEGSQEQANVDEIESNSDEDILQQMKAMQQYENLQKLYGDDDAHVVAKKNGYNHIDMDAYNNAFNNAGDGSGEQAMQGHQIANEQRLEYKSRQEKPVFDMPVM